MWYVLYWLLKVTRCRLVVNFSVSWSYVESCLIGNHTTPSFLYGIPCEVCGTFLGGKGGVMGVKPIML